MKKFYAFAVFLAVFALNMQAQVIDSNHPTLDYYGPDNITLEGHADITNMGPNTLNIIAERFSQTVMPNHYTYFCWVVCYDTVVLVSPSPVTVAAGATTNLFKSYVYPSFVPGIDHVTYRFYDMNGLADTLYLTFNFEFSSTAGISQLSVSKHSMTITGANPVNTSAMISYTTSSAKDAKIVVSNLLGSKVYETQLGTKAGSVVIPVADLKSGVYLCSLIVDGSIMTSKKLIVSHR